MADDGHGTSDRVTSPGHPFDLIPPPRRRGLAAAETVVLGAAAAVLVAAVAVLVSGAAEETPAPSTAPYTRGSPEPAGPTAPPVLLAHQEPSGRASSLTVLVPAAGGKGGTLLLIPPGTMTEVVSLGL